MKKPTYKELEDKMKKLNEEVDYWYYAGIIITMVFLIILGICLYLNDENYQQGFSDGQMNCSKINIEKINFNGEAYAGMDNHLGLNYVKIRNETTQEYLEVGKLNINLNNSELKIGCSTILIPINETKLCEVKDEE